MRYWKLWLSFAFVIVASFGVLGYYGHEIYLQAPPIPKRVVDTDGNVLFTDKDIRDGQNVWQSMGGQEIGSVWGHGAYQAPDWSADWLHRELVAILDRWSQAEHGKSYGDLEGSTQAVLRERLKKEIRTNTYQSDTGDLIVSQVRAGAIGETGDHYARLFGEDPDLQDLRESYAIPAGTLKDPERKRLLNAFFFWAAWACATNRPGQEITYTNNWPPERLIDNSPTGSIVLWSMISVVLLLAGIGALAWYQAVQRHKEDPPAVVPERDPLLSLQLTPSMKATLKYFWVVAALFLVQVGLGVITAHYTVEGLGFYGLPLAEWFPYAVTRTWHIQLGIFWIATAWLATGLFVAPAVSGYEPKFQKLGVQFLFVCLLVIVVGSMFGQWLSIQQKLGLTAGFWFGHQGLEYVDLGRFWQWFLFVGLFVWLALVGRALRPAFREGGANRHLLTLFLISAFAIAGFYGAGLAWGQHSHYSMIEYWRWWVVHLWVEGFFEVFATVVIAFLFTRMGLLRVASATAAVLFSCVLFLSGGIIGTFHHLYFSGTPTAVLALGSVFSALEVVPLVLIGFEAYESLNLPRAKPWVEGYRWPIYFFVAVSFWNMVGAGLFGFLINPPVALYYMQGLNTTPVHGHAALFGVYGMLGLGLLLFSLKGMTASQPWKTRVLALSFWAINIGLALMVTISLLPVGLLQAWASVDTGMWYARSAEFLGSDLVTTLRWLRVIGDTVFVIGAVGFCWFVAGLRGGWSLAGESAKPVPGLMETPATGK